MMGNAGWALLSVCGKTGRRLMMSRRCRANEGRLEAGRQRRYIGTVKLRSWYSGSDEIDFVVGSRGKRRRASSCTSSFPKRWAWQIGLGLRLGTGESYAQYSSTAKGRSVQRLSLQAVERSRLWREKLSSDYSLFALLCRQSVGAFLYYDALSP